MRIIDPNPQPQVEKEKVCPTCGCLFAYVPLDLVRQDYRDYGGTSDYYYKVICPKCQKEVRI